jgi:hypothetical protein
MGVLVVEGGLVTWVVEGAAVLAAGIPTGAGCVTGFPKDFGIPDNCEKKNVNDLFCSENE